MNTEHTDIIYHLIRELASELDLHYEDSEFFALKPTIRIMQEGAAALSAAGREPPTVYAHTIARFNRQQN